MKPSKKVIIITAAAIASLQLIACAHNPYPATNRAPLTYDCSAMEPDMAQLIDSAADHATKAGYPTYRRDGEATLWFEPSTSFQRTVFINSPLYRDFPMLPQTPALERRGGVIEVVVKRGGLVRDGDLVEMYVDLFLGLN